MSASGHNHFVIVRNVPDALTTAELRGFFKDARTFKWLSCFHYLHNIDYEMGSRPPVKCCLVSCTSDESRERFVERYDNVPWKNLLRFVSTSLLCRVQITTPVDYARITAEQNNVQEGGSSSSDKKPKVFGIAVNDAVTESPLKHRQAKAAAYQSKYQTRSEKRQQLAKETGGHEELHPPPELPQGNVGTPDAVLEQLTRACKLPSSVANLLPDAKKAASSGGVAIPPPGERWHEDAEHSPHASKSDKVIELASISSKKRLKRKSGEVAGAISVEVIDDSDDGNDTEVEKGDSGESAASKKEKDSEDDGSLFRKPTLAPSALRRAGNMPQQNIRKATANIEKRARNDYVEDFDELEHAKVPVPDDVQDWAIDEAVTEFIPEVHYQKNNRMDSLAGPLHEDDVDKPWDKGDASGLVTYTDAYYWDKVRDHDGRNDFEAVDVEFEEKDRSENWHASEHPEDFHDRRRREKSEEEGSKPSHFDKVVKKGVAAKMMKKWGWRDGLELGAGVAKKKARIGPLAHLKPRASQVYLDVIEPMVTEPLERQSLGRAPGLGFSDDGGKKKDTQDHAPPELLDLPNKIGSVHDESYEDLHPDAMKHRSVSDPVSSSAAASRSKPIAGAFQTNQQSVKFRLIDNKGVGLGGSVNFVPGGTQTDE